LRSIEFFDLLAPVTDSWLVSRHHAKLYAPADYRLDQSFIEASAAVSTCCTEVIRKERFDVVISDLCRPPDNRAGLTLLTRLKAKGFKSPYFTTPTRRRESRWKPGGEASPESRVVRKS